MTKAEKEKYKTALIGKRLQWDGGREGGIIYDLTFYRDGALGISFHNEHGDFNYESLSKDNAERLMREGRWTGAFCNFEVVEDSINLSKARQVQEILDHTTKDITALKEQVIGMDKRQEVFYLDNSAREYLIYLRQLLATYQRRIYE